MRQRDRTYRSTKNFVVRQVRIENIVLPDSFRIHCLGGVSFQTNPLPERRQVRIVQNLVERNKLSLQVSDGQRLGNFEVLFGIGRAFDKALSVPGDDASCGFLLIASGCFLLGDGIVKGGFQNVRNRDRVQRDACSTENYIRTNLVAIQLERHSPMIACLYSSQGGDIRKVMNGGSREVVVGPILSDWPTDEHRCCFRQYALLERENSD